MYAHISPSNAKLKQSVCFAVHSEVFLPSQGPPGSPGKSGRTGSSGVQVFFCAFNEQIVFFNFVY